MKILVTGCSGYLGGQIVNRLIQEGHEVIAISRSNKHTLNKGCTFISADITSKTSLLKVSDSHPDIETIIHLAALVPREKSEDQAEAMFEMNTMGTVTLLEVFGKGLRNLVYASTAEVYGLPSMRGTIAEDVLPDPQSYYGASKLAGESFCRVYAARNEVPVAILRFTVLYGPGDRINRAVPNFINRALSGNNLQIFGGEELRDYLHIIDAAEALYLAAVKQANGVFNIGTGKGVAIRDTAKAIITATGTDASMDIQPREKPAADIVLNIEKAKRAFGFKPRYTFPDLLDEQIAWHKQQK